MENIDKECEFRQKFSKFKLEQVYATKNTSMHLNV
jgi:hypothetical protein